MARLAAVRGSIRFRLTAWYTLLLAAVLLGAVFSIRALLERELRTDLDHRLLTTANVIVDRVRVQPGFPNQLSLRFPALDPIAFPGLLIQVVDANNTVRVGSSGLEDQVLPAASVSPDDPHPAFRTAQVAGTELRTVRDPLILTSADGRRIVGAVIVGESFLPLDRTMARLQQILLAASVIGVALAAVGGWLLANSALRPVDRLTATASAIASEAESTAALTTRLAVPPTGDEIARLATAFNAMLDRLEAAFATQRRLVADASHELRTPLTAIRSNVDVLIQQVAAGQSVNGQELAAGLDGIRRGAARMGRLLDELLQLARTDAAAGLDRFEPVRLDRVAQDALETARSLAAGQILELRGQGPVALLGDADQLYQLIVILLDNALRHTPPNGHVTLAIDRPHPSQATLVVRDTGEGIAPEHLPHIFERFYRADGARTRATGGAGLGLAIAQAIARTHGGDISVTSAPGAGSAFTVRLPALPPDSANGDLAAAAPRDAPTKHEALGG